METHTIGKVEQVFHHIGVWLAIGISQAVLLFLNLAILKAPLVFLLLAIAGNWIAAECLLFFYEKLPYLKVKQFLLIEFLPMALILIAFIITAIILYHGHIADVNQLWFLESDQNASEQVITRNFITLMIVFGIQFFAVTLLSLHQCPHCGKGGFGLYKNRKDEMIGFQYVQTGTTDNYQSFTATDTAGNTYSGSVDCGSSPTYDKYETRKKTVICKLCNTRHESVKVYRIGLIRKIIDSVTKVKE